MQQGWRDSSSSSEWVYLGGRGGAVRMFVKWYQFRSEVSVFVWGVGGRGSSGTSGGKEERVVQDLEPRSNSLRFEC